MSKKYILLYQKRYCFSLVSDWENIYKIPFCIGPEKKNGKASEAQSLNVRLSLCWAGSVCWGSRQQKENKSCLKNYFSGHEILVSGYYPVYPLCSSVTFAMGSETLQHLSNDRKGNSSPGVTKSSTQAGLQSSIGRRKRILGVVVSIELNMSQCCALVQRGPAASFAALGNVASRSMELILPFYSGLLGPYVEYQVQQWAP